MSAPVGMGGRAKNTRADTPASPMAEEDDDEEQPASRNDNDELNGHNGKVTGDSSAKSKSNAAADPAAAVVEDNYEITGGTDEVILATAGYDGTIKFWQAHTGKCVRTLQHSDSQVNALAIAPDGMILAVGGYQHIRMFDVQGASNANPVVNYEGVSKNVMDLGFQEEGRWMYTGGEDSCVKIWDLRMRNLQCQRSYQCPGGAAANSVVLHPNQQELIIGDQNGVVHIWNLRTDQKEQIIPQSGASIQCVAVDQKGHFMAAVTNKATAHIWELKSGSDGRTLVEHTKQFPAHKRYTLSCKFSPDSSMLATSSADQTTRLWRTADFSLITELQVENQRWVWDLAFSADSQYLFTATSDNVARLWSLPTNEVKREYVGHQKPLTCLAFKDGQLN